MTSLTKERHPLLAIPAITLMLALVATGCGHDSSGTDSEASGLKYSQCMRSQGVAWYPDPLPNGDMVASEPPGDDHQKLKAAEQACRKYNPVNEANPVSAADLAKLRKMSQCMRDQGITNYPDPDTNGAVNLDKSSGISPDDPSFTKALAVCKRYGPAAVQGS
jgi:hypothetical protein